ncbi:MAG TPA: heavy metal-binding domain-containing protein [Bacteroidales bacterium]|nr:heavy metal-binding domain-containing protein [Bacteroidales bacterium]
MGIFSKKNKEEKTSSASGESSESGLKYQCPMKCEGEKTYDQPGRCPVCKMYLQPVEKKV